MELPELMKQWRAKRGQESFRVVMFGSSNTEIGWHSEGRHGWPCWLSCIFRASVGQHIFSLNTGIGGNTARDLLGRIRGDVLPVQPHLVIITIGGNDYFQKHSLDEFEANLRKLHQILRDAGALVVFQTYYALLPEAGAGLGAYMDVIRRVARTTEAGLIDQYAWFGPWRDGALEQYRQIMRDPAHLKPVGNALFGTLAGRTFGCQDPAMPADLEIHNYLPALEAVGAPHRKLKMDWLE
ncbi:MAG: hypothetical protein PCFJNLEI_02124 [Verrucomicrobiae bacterium]|nr:hypothetical protein [Verrucomicrobiae bacterium]